MKFLSRFRKIIIIIGYYNQQCVISLRSTENNGKPLQCIKRLHIRVKFVILIFQVTVT